LSSQYDIVENPAARSRRSFPFLIVLQSAQAAVFSTTIVAPLVPEGAGFERSRIHPVIEVEDTRYVVLCERLAAVEKRDLGRVVTSARAYRYEVTAALDMLFTGV
jgi:hypothetical protein